MLAASSTAVSRIRWARLARSGCSAQRSNAARKMAVPTLLGAGEQHVPPVGEVARERPAGQPGPHGDLGHGDVIEAVREEQLERGIAEPVPGLRRD
jgi:hypothetical protein